MLKFLRTFPSLLIDAIKMFFNFSNGVRKLFHLTEPRITFFGGARWKESDLYAYQANLLAKRLAEYGLSVVTGGGPGIMEAANCGAGEVGEKNNKKQSMGITVKDIPNEDGLNPCAQEKLTAINFYIRKWLLISYSEAFVIFPGGYGTLDELCTVLTLLQTKKMDPSPIILIGTEYWKPFMSFLEEAALKHGTITSDEFKFIKITDDLDEALLLLCEHCKKFITSN